MCVCLWRKDVHRNPPRHALTPNAIQTRLFFSKLGLAMPFFFLHHCTAMAKVQLYQLMQGGGGGMRSAFFRIFRLFFPAFFGQVP